MKTYLPRISKFILSTLLILFISFSNSAFAACDFPAFDENADRNYSVDDIISRDGKDYQVVVAGWANAHGSDWAYAPGTGTYWNTAWNLVNDPCTDTGVNTDTTTTDTTDTDTTTTDTTTTNTNTGSCTGSVDDHGHGTWYDNLDSDPNGVVKCSFERADIIGTKYGALDKGLLIQNGGTPYCGMCVEATGEQGTAIIQIVDECPDCYDRNPDGSINTGTNTKYGDIDLSIEAFKAVVDNDYVAKGIGDFDWQEVTCPWQNNLHLIIQGSHDWYAKVIVGNHTNRIASVEISNDGGSSWEAMTLGVDNGWTKGSYGGTDKTFKITDIYGNDVIIPAVNMISDLSGGAAKIDGGSNFPGCTVTSTKELINSLDYVTTYPNPANTSITFSGIKEVKTIQIININGQIIETKSLSNSAQITYDVSNLAPGIYVAKMIGNTNTGTVTFVKK